MYCMLSLMAISTVLRVGSHSEPEETYDDTFVATHNRYYVLIVRSGWLSNETWQNMPEPMVNETASDAQCATRLSPYTTTCNGTQGGNMVLTWLLNLDSDTLLLFF
ncbi:hypothetical protein M406DRAFT_356052 [Cryphonectria parasitica EP155]|uniref:Uncharacterized protein n=1 Tax=Cryphonectria parasitica (strain ATCC 38755 / EP155) TaxID=660469 RepID=A0A9P4Y3I6_CRYP1|nr:uncharacterized protein M406DRAFT_356052 [Cryphonectria parasitica EP155]KAF3765790.1 hypothetical protein M406DRAFT_356052 [Cryphonectria parasitica EP155]